MRCWPFEDRRGGWHVMKCSSMTPSCLTPQLSAKCVPRLPFCCSATKEYGIALCICMRASTLPANSSRVKLV